MSLTQAQRALRAQQAAHTSWAKTIDPAARTVPARAAALDRFEREIAEKYPDVPEAQRAVMAEHARKAYFLRLALKSAQVRRARRGGAT